MELVIVRHAQSEGNVAKLDIPDPELTELGTEQARRVAERLSRERFDRILASPMIRTLETACLIASANTGNPPVEAFFNLREIRGSSDKFCTPGSVLKKRFPRVLFKEGIFDTDTPWTYPGGETRPACQCRARAILAAVMSAAGPDDKVLIVSHVGFIVALISSILSLAPGGFEFSQENTAVSKFLFGPGPVRAVYINDFSHLI